MRTFSLLFICAMQYLNAPYKWAANGPFEFDCSGLVLRSLRDYYKLTGRSDEAKKIKDMTSQGFYEWLVDKGLQCEPPTEDCFLFYGKSTDKITHVALAGHNMLIEAGGGDSKMTWNDRDVLLEQCAKKDARVRLRTIGHRSDLVASIKFTL